MARGISCGSKFKACERRSSMPALMVAKGRE